MPGLQDLLLLRQLQDQANPMRSAFQSLADGVSIGIEETRNIQKQKKIEAEQRDVDLKGATDFVNTYGGKMEATFKNGKTGITVIPKATTTEIPSGFKIKSINSKGEPTYVEENTMQDKREERLTSQYELNNVTKLRQEFINRPEVKDYVTVSTNVRAMEGLLDKAVSSGNKENLVAVDQGLITMYNKLTDPQSVVRESEYARTPGNLPVVNRIYGAITKVQQGGAGLTNEDRKALVLGANIILKERGQTYNNALGEYTDLSSKYGLDSSMVTRGMKPYSSDITTKEPNKIGRFTVEVE